MSFNLRWRPTARDELTRIWLDADSQIRKHITQSCHRLEESIQRSPFDVGESRTGDIRVAFDPPLGVLFRVDAQNRLARVIHVWRIALKGGSPK